MENIAYIQLDEKKAKLLIVQSRNGRYRVLEEVENYYDLAKDLTVDCLFSPKTRTDILKVMNIYRYTIETYKVGKMIALASNIIVKARNYRGLLDEIYTNTGINFSLMSDEEVVKYTYLSLMQSVDVSKGYIINVGAFQTYILKFNRRNVIEFNTLPYGFTNLSQSGMTFLDMTATVRKEICKLSLACSYEEDQVIGCGSTFIDVARIAKKLTRYPIDIDNNYDLSKSAVEKVADFVKEVDAQKVKKIKGLGQNGAENLNGGLAIVSAIYEAFKIDNVTVSTAEALQGLVLANVVGSANEKYSDLLQNSLDNYYEFKKEGLAINSNVYDMAILLFKQLKVVHKLPRAYVKPLKIAAYMFDCGKYINFKDFQKHSFYAILNSNVAGASQKDLLIGAFACTCQNLDNFNLAEVMKYKELLDDDDVDAIRKLGVVINLAVNLNASRKNVITDIICDILGDSIIMKTVVSSDPSFEIIQSMKISDDFKKIFKKSLQII